MTSLPSLFKNQSYWQLALTHRSYCNEHPSSLSNERLEFLGDSVLSLIISERLYQLFPDQQEGILTARRSYLVQTTSLAKKALVLGLDTQLLLSHGEQELGGRQNFSLLADTFEAVLGGLYLDSGLDACRHFLEEVFPDSEISADYEIKDPKSMFQEKAQSQNLGTPIYRTLSATGPDHAKIFVVEVLLSDRVITTGQGPSKQKAETEAARSALTKLFSS